MVGNFRFKNRVLLYEMIQRLRFHRALMLLNDIILKGKLPITSNQ